VSAAEQADGNAATLDHRVYHLFAATVMRLADKGVLHHIGGQGCVDPERGV
jgi:hypothetical protein